MKKILHIFPDSRRVFGLLYLLLLVTSFKLLNTVVYGLKSSPHETSLRRKYETKNKKWRMI